MKVIVEVGANDGVLQDKTARLIEQGWKALLIEPCSFYYDKLVDKHINNDNVLCHNVAISSVEQERDMFYVHPEDIKDKQLPAWVGLLGSFDIEHIRKHVFDKSIRIIKETVKCVPLNKSLQDNGIISIDLLVLDVEGAELDILRSLDFKTYNPRVIDAEIKHLSETDKKQLIGLLNDNGYSVVPMVDTFGNATVLACKRQQHTSHKTSGRKAVATFADKRFLSGLEVMVHSLLKHTLLDTKAWELVVLSNELTEDDLTTVKKMWQSLVVKRFETSKYDMINVRLKKELSGANGSYNKFELFGLDEFDRVVALDSDLLFLQDASELFDSKASIAAVKELLIDQYNSGVMVIGSDFLGWDVVAGLIEMTEIMGPKEHADQDTISAYFWNDFSELSINLNFLKIYYNYPFLQKYPFPAHIKVLHYIIHKPWLNNNSINEIEVGTQGLDGLWHNAYNEMKLMYSGK